MYSYVDVTSYVLLANLPADIVKILPWSSPATVTGIAEGPTGAMPADFWTKIGAVASTLVNVLVCASQPSCLGQMIYKGLVALGTFLVNLAQAIVDWGMKQVGALWNNIVAVAQKAGEVLSQFVNWIVDGAVSLFRSGLPKLDIGFIVNSIGLPVIPIDGSGVASGAVNALLTAVFSGWFFYALVAVGLLVQLVATYLTLQSLGMALIVSHLIAPKIIEILVQSWLKTIIAIGVGLAITASIAAILYLVMPSADPFWREGLGLSFISIALTVEKFPQIVKGFRVDPTGVAKELTGFAIAILGLFIAFTQTGLTGAFWGFVFTAAGAAIVLYNDDVFDLSPASPLKNMEEIMSVVSLSYAVVNLAKEITK